MPAAFPIAGAETPRGFTGHEHLDGVQLIHMNGRVYDPMLGRFLSADPVIQFPKSTQGLNRYTYTNNNPLSYTDPSGFFFSKIVKGIVGAIVGIGKTAVASVKGIYRGAKESLRSPFVQIAGSIVVGVLTGGAGAAVFNTLVSLANGASLGDALLSGAITLATAYASAQISVHFGSGGFLSGNHIVRTVAQGVVGGTASIARGGKFQSGFAAGAASAFAGTGINALNGGNVFEVVATGLVGGASAELGGGKFKHGAISAAFQRLYALGSHEFLAAGRSPTSLQVASNAAAGASAAPAGSGVLESILNGIRTVLGRANAWLLALSLSSDTRRADRIVIGEDMKGRVIPHAISIGAEFYNPPEAPRELWMEQNRLWINDKMDRQYDIIDIGAAPGRTNYPEPTSPFYKMELGEIARRNYSQHFRVDPGF